jgi:hypothetical protein
MGAVGLLLFSFRDKALISPPASLQLVLPPSNAASPAAALPLRQPTALAVPCRIRPPSHGLPRPRARGRAGMQQGARRAAAPLPLPPKQATFIGRLGNLAPLRHTTSRHAAAAARPMSMAAGPTAFRTPDDGVPREPARGCRGPRRVSPRPAVVRARPHPGLEALRPAGPCIRRPLRPILEKLWFGELAHACLPGRGRATPGALPSPVLPPSTLGSRVRSAAEYARQPSTLGSRVRSAAEYARQPSTLGSRVRSAAEYARQPSTLGSRVRSAAEYARQPSTLGSRSQPAECNGCCCARVLRHTVCWLACITTACLHCGCVLKSRLPSQRLPACTLSAVSPPHTFRRQ